MTHRRVNAYFNLVYFSPWPYLKQYAAFFAIIMSHALVLIPRNPLLYSYTFTKHQDLSRYNFSDAWHAFLLLASKWKRSRLWNLVCQQLNRSGTCSDNEHEVPDAALQKVPYEWLTGNLRPCMCSDSRLIHSSTKGVAIKVGLQQGRYCGCSLTVRTITRKYYTVKYSLRWTWDITVSWNLFSWRVKLLWHAAHSRKH